MILSWGKPRIFVKKDGATEWSELPTPVEDSTELQTTQGDVVEAKIEGGENEDKRIKRSTYALTYNIRKTKGRNQPFVMEDGVIKDNYKVAVIPEDSSCYGFLIDKTSSSVSDTFTAADGAMWQIRHDALKPALGATVKWGTFAISKDGTTITFTENVISSTNKALADVGGFTINIYEDAEPDTETENTETANP